ncbi:MAG: phosphonate ABC transporter, permease protein PhnE [Myxococcota bacterium]|nr:phosphonate ABC transporter, permease protein PhnE [Myxococcota bacterium]
MLQSRDATKRYADGTAALRGVTLDVPRGQFCVILGSSGAGKSTLLRAVNGLVTLTSGTIEVDGTTVSSKTLSAVRSKLGTVHQSFCLVGRATVLENVLGGALCEVSTARAMFGSFLKRYRRKACALLDDLGLSEEHLYRRAAELSGGQQQRVAIARAFILDPALVLADEPVASLDMDMSQTILRLLRETSARRGATVICSLHQVDLARQFADRIVAMRAGEVIADGPPTDLDDAALERIYSRVATHAGTGAATVGTGAGRIQLGAVRKAPGDWALRQPISKRTIVIALVASVLLAISARRTEIPHILTLTAQWIGAGVGLRGESEIGKGLGRFASNAFPLVIARETQVSRVEGLDREHLPLFAHIERRDIKTSRYDFEQRKMVETSDAQEVLVEPVGYLVYVCGKMLQTLEIALWATLFALAAGLPIAYLGARGYAPNRWIYLLSRATSSFCRAVPELVSVLILVLAFGFGPMAGVIALGFHSTGFFGKFFADDVENADRAPQEALFAAGANRLKVLRYAVLPQVLPQYVAYTQYILERNVRMATVIGAVGAGGIGIELKGRFDMFDFGHVSTILVVIFVTVLLLERLSQRLRGGLMAAG